MPNGFYFSKFKVNLRLSEKASLPSYLGSTLRGALGSTLHNLVCPLTQERNCDRCLINTQCVFSYIFLTPKDNKATLSYKYENYPHPYVIEPPLDNSSNIEDTLSFNLILIGKAIDYLPYFLLVFEKFRLGTTRIKCFLESIEDSLSTQKKIIYDGQKKRFVGTPAAKKFEDITSECSKDNISFLTIQFLTNTRLKYRSEMQKAINFEVFMRCILRRFRTLCERHCSFKPVIPHESLLLKAKEVKVIDAQLDWRDWKRFSRRQDKRVDFPGFVGKISFQGKMREFLPFIKLGEYIHIGKNTSFGLGQYKVVN